MSTGPDQASEDKHERWLAAYYRSELTTLRFEFEEQRRRLRRCTAWFVAASALSVLMSAIVVAQALYGDLLDRAAGLMRRLGLL